jgi:hypothetical protein
MADPTIPTVLAPAWAPADDNFERAVVFESGWNDRGGQYGVHGMEIRFLLRGPKGVAQFVMNAGWIPGEKGISPRLADYFPSGSDLGYHAHVPQYDGAMEGRSECPYLDGKPCFYDGSGLQAEPVLTDFIQRGEVAVWEALRERHDDLTGGTS